MKSKNIEIILIVIFIVSCFCSFCSCNKQEQIVNQEKNESILKKLRMDGFLSMLGDAKTEEERNLVFALKTWQIILSTVKIDRNSKISEFTQRKIGQRTISNKLSWLAAMIKTGRINTETSIYPEDIKRAVECLYEAFCVIADNEGNNDGIYTEEEQKSFAKKNIYVYSIFLKVIEIY